MKVPNSNLQEIWVEQQNKEFQENRRWSWWRALEWINAQFYSLIASIEVIEVIRKAEVKLINKTDTRIIIIRKYRGDVKLNNKKLSEIQK